MEFVQFVQEIWYTTDKDVYVPMARPEKVHLVSVNAKEIKFLILKEIVIPVVITK